MSMGIDRNDLTDWVRVDLVRNDRGFETTVNQWAWNTYTVNPYQDSSFVRMYFPVNFIIADIEAKRFKSVHVKSFYNQLLETKKKITWFIETFSINNDALKSGKYWNLFLLGFTISDGLNLYARALN